MISNNEGSGGGENQLDKIVVQVKESEQLASTAKVLKKLILLVIKLENDLMQFQKSNLTILKR